MDRSLKTISFSLSIQSIVSIDVMYTVTIVGLTSVDLFEMQQ
jgi:hypothetical protein